MPVPDKPPEARTRRGPGRSSPGTRQKGSPYPQPKSHRTRGVRQSGATAVLDTCVDQLDGLAGLGADAVLHGDRLDLVDVVAAVDRIGQRLGAAVAVLDLREPPS